MSDRATYDSGDPAPPDGRPAKAERRLAASIAVVVSMVLPILLPDRLALGPVWIVPVIEGVLLIAILAVDPGRIDRRGRQIRGLSIGLVVILAASAAWGTGRLVWDLLQGDPQTTDPSSLLLAGALVWTQNIVAFSFVYWELDGGGPATRYFDLRSYPDLGFPQQLNPEIAPPGWGPVFVDYLYLSVTNAMAFSPTDVMPLARWAKLTMAFQSMISIVILSLVIANSVNLLS